MYQNSIFISKIKELERKREKEKFKSFVKLMIIYRPCDVIHTFPL